MITKRLIIFLIRKRLGLKLGERFRFTNQKSKYDKYYFDRNRLVKLLYCDSDLPHLNMDSSVSLNWLLALDPKKDICKVEE